MTIFDEPFKKYRERMSDYGGYKWEDHDGKVLFLLWEILEVLWEIGILALEIRDGARVPPPSVVQTEEREDNEQSK